MRQCCSKRGALAGLDSARSALIAALNVCLSVRCEGNGKNVNYSFCKIDIRGDHEQLVWQLCKPGQLKQGIGAIAAEGCRYPNLLAVKDDFSQNTLKVCFAELLAGDEKLQNAYKIRENAMATSSEAVKVLRSMVAEGLSGNTIEPEESKYLEERIQQIETKIDDLTQSTANLNPETLRKAYRLNVYSLDLNALVGQLSLRRDAVREKLAKELEVVKKTTSESNLRGSVDSDQAIETSADDNVQRYLQCNWSMEDLIKMKIAERTPYNNEFYYRYDHQARIISSERELPQFDIFKPWKVLLRWTDVNDDARSQISEQGFKELLKEYEDTQKSLRQCLAYAILRLTRRKLNEILSAKPTAKTLSLYKQKTMLDFSTNPPTEEFQVVTSALVRQQDACKEFNDEISVQKTKEEKRIEDQEAERAL